MSTTTFQWDALQWLREEAGLATEVRPADRIEDPDAPLLVEGFVVHPSKAGAYAYGALWVVTCAVLLAMLRMPGMSETTEVLLNRVGQLGFGVAAAMLVLAWVVSRRHRSPALVQLHPPPAPPTVATITELHERARGATVWIVADRAPAPEVLDAAAERGVRCFVRGTGGRFEPVAAQSSSRSSATTG